ncbi:uncharacterized protein LOC111102693 isoform X2 [Crassostrea virginica]
MYTFRLINRHLHQINNRFKFSEIVQEVISMMQRLTIFTIVCFFFGLANSKQCKRAEGWVCCPGFVLNKTSNQCIPCMDGYYGIDCRSCPSPYFGKDCTSICNCIDGEQCHHIFGCTKTQGSGPEERSTVSSFRLHQNTAAMHTNELHRCSNKRKHLNFPRHFLSVTTACFTAISGVFLVLYTGLHFLKIEIQQKTRPDIV